MTSTVVFTHCVRVKQNDNHVEQTLVNRSLPGRFFRYNIFVGKLVFLTPIPGELNKRFFFEGIPFISEANAVERVFKTPVRTPALQRDVQKLSCRRS